MSQSLYVRDGNGTLKELEVVSGSNASRIVPVHSLTGSIAATLSPADLSTLTSSISAVSSAVGLFNQQLYQALTGGPVSMSVDIVAGDVNAITGSVDKVTAELVKLTALSSSTGLLVTGSVTANISNALGTNPLYVSSSALYPVVTALSGVTLVNGSVPVTGTLSVDVVIGDQIGISSSLASPVYVTGAVNVGNTLTTSPAKATTSSLVVLDYATNPSGSNLAAGTRATVVFSNQTNASVLIALTASAASNTNFSYYLMPFETYESAPANAGLPHSFNYTGSATAGYWALTTTV